MNIEVLAPVGSFAIAKDVLNANCDAIYLGGIEFNMRMHSKLLNFKNDEIAETVKIAHNLGKKVYVTVNTWFNDEETELLKDYLIFLEQIQVDAIIVQDLGIINILKKLNLDIEVHASVMMNVHNLEQAKALETDFPITRFVLSRELPLIDVKQISNEINSEIEYFVSGDMCSVNGGICYASALLFNKSSNKGQCFKMCRWKYDLKYGGNLYKADYYLAAKDMDMVSHIDKLIEAGVNSLKIEGRRKKIEDTLEIINTYGLAVEKYKQSDYNSSEYIGKLDHMYPRDVSTAYAFGNPGLDFINTKNEGNPDVLRIFSKKGHELPTSTRKVSNAKRIFPNGEATSEISVKTDSYKAAKYALDNHVSNLYICIESFKEELQLEQIQRLIDCKGNTKVFLSMPIMQSAASKVIQEELIENLNNLDGVVVSDYGQLHKYRDKFEIKTDFTFNVMNKEALELLFESGATSVMPSIEATPKELTSLISSGAKLDILVFGRLTTMYSDLNLYENVEKAEVIGASNNKYFESDVLVLENGTGQENPVFLDNFKKSHIMTQHVLNIIPLFDKLKGNNLVIDTRTVNEEDYMLAIKTLSLLINSGQIENEITESNSEKYFLGALGHTVKGAKYVIVK